MFETVAALFWYATDGQVSKFVSVQTGKFLRVGGGDQHTKNDAFYFVFRF